MIYCSKCGKENPDDGNFCIACGVKLVHTPGDSNQPAGSSQPVNRPAQVNITAGNWANKTGAIGAVMVLVGFFLPWFSGFISINGFEIIFGSMSAGLDNEKYLLLPLPVASVLLLIHVFVKRLDKGKGLGNLLKVMPLVFFIIYGAIIFSKIMDNRSADDIGEILQIFGVGYWLTLAGAVVMCFHKENKV